MKKYRGLILLVTMILSIILIYNVFKDNKINYVALGDDLVVGLDKSYPDFLVDILKEEKRLKSYTNYSKKGLTSKDMLNEISYNPRLKKDLRESDLVTITIGFNDLFNIISEEDLNINELLNRREDIDKVMPEIKNLIKEIRKYAKKDIIIVGYYNPVPFLFNINTKELDLLFAYIDEEYRKIAKKYKGKYISNYELFKNNKELLPDPMSNYPSLEGYKRIAENIYKKIK